MTLSRKRILIGLGILVLLGMIVLWAVRGDEDQAGPVPTPAPTASVETVQAKDIPFQIDLPSVTTAQRLVFSTYRRTALGSSDLSGSGLEKLTPQAFRYMDDVRWSPDGSRAVIKAPGRTVLFDRGELRNINRGIEHVVWAPDNERFAYTFQGAPHVYDVRNSRFTKLTDSSLGNQFSWSTDGSRLAVYANVHETPEGSELSLITVASRKVERTGQQAVVSAVWSPDDAHLLITRSKDDVPALYRYDVKSKEADSLSLAALAEKTAWVDADRFYIAAPLKTEAGYLKFGTETDDVLWSITGAGKRVVTDFDGSVNAMRLLEDKLVVLTPTSIYQVMVSR